MRYPFYQKTISHGVEWAGIGLHSGRECRIRIEPAQPHSGIQFRRVDVDSAKEISAHISQVVDTENATTLGSLTDPELRIQTVEHVLAALYMSGVTNAHLLVWGPEVPILDGSAEPYFQGLVKAGIVTQQALRPVLRLVKPLHLAYHGMTCELLPRSQFRITSSVRFDHPLIGLQTFGLDITPQAFAAEIACARTFGFVEQAESLRRRGLARGASLENVLAYSANGIENPEGTRFFDECVRHKILDAIGDLALFGAWIEAELVTLRGGHAVHCELLRVLEESTDKWEWRVAPQPKRLSIPFEKANDKEPVSPQPAPSYFSAVRPMT